VVLQGLGVCFAVFDALEDVEDDACEAVAVEVDFLCVGDLSDLAVVFFVQPRLVLLFLFSTYGEFSFFFCNLVLKVLLGLPHVLKCRWEVDCDCAAVEIGFLVGCHDVYNVRGTRLFWVDR